MPMYDKQCNQCGAIEEDAYEPISSPDAPCSCGGVLKRKTFPGKSALVIPDSIPGGVWIRHGICNDDGTPRRYDSHSEMREAAKVKNMVNRVEHVGSRGSDKNKFTSRWV